MKTEVTGTSVAGIETCIEVPSFKLLMDLGICSPSAVFKPVVLVSHGHLDHIGAITQHAARRALMNLGESTYVVPNGLAPALERLFNAAGELDGQTIPRRIVPLHVGECFRLGKRRFARPFPTFHPVPSQGYTIFEERHRLRPEFQGRPGAELAELRRKHIEIEETHAVPIVSYTGDTRIEALEMSEELQRTETLVLETTYLDDLVSVQAAREMGHVHLDEIEQRLPLLSHQNVVFFHFSARYTREDVQRIVRARLPEELFSRTRLLGIDAGGGPAPMEPRHGA